LNWIDLHTHLNMLETTPEETLAEAEKVGVHHVVTIATEPEDHETVLELAAKYPKQVSATLGVHPHEAKKWTKSTSNFFEANLTRPEVVAVGEIGLDYYYEHSERPTQVSVFEEQMSLAHHFGLPVEIHTRDAEKETVEVLKKYRTKVSGVLHCFTGSRWLAFQALDQGFDISISGVVTFKNAEELRETVKAIPMDRIHVETDAPFLAPVPMRGKKNTPVFLPHTAAYVATLHNILLEALSLQTIANARRTFPKLAARLPAVYC